MYLICAKNTNSLCKDTKYKYTAKMFVSCIPGIISRVSQNFKKFNFLDIELHTAVYVPKKKPKKNS